MRLPAAALLFFGAMASAAPAPIEIPGGSAGVGFDDLRFSVSLGKVLVPAGRTGSLVLLDPATRNVTAVEGFSAKKEYGGGHDVGVTSADSGRGRVFATDRTSGLLAIIDPAGRRIVSRSKLGGAPDYVRYVEPSGEVWVTEPDSERIEIFHLLAGIPPAAVHDGFLPVPGGPESLAVDARRGRAYTHLWNGKTVAIDVKARRIAATWNNGCKASRGLALDEARGFLFAACSDGKGRCPGCRDRQGAVLRPLRKRRGRDRLRREALAPVPSRREERDDGRPRRVPRREAVASRHEADGGRRALRRLRREAGMSSSAIRGGEGCWSSRTSTDRAVEKP